MSVPGPHQDRPHDRPDLQPRVPPGRWPIETLRLEIQRRLDRALDAYYPRNDSPEVVAVIDSYLRRPAKLLRPRLLLLSANRYGPDAPVEPLLELAAATELLHVFALMHDDRMDRDGREGVELPQDTGNGAYLVLAGDLLHTLAIGMIEECVTGNQLSPSIPRWVRQVSCRTIAGQASDVRFLTKNGAPGIDSLYELYDLKTGYYSFVAPLIIGALAVGRDESSYLEALGLLVGRAFQLRDDESDLRRRMAGHTAGESTPWELNLLATLEESAPKKSEPAQAARAPAFETGPTSGEGAAGAGSRAAEAASRDAAEPAESAGPDALARRAEAIALHETVDRRAAALLEEALRVAERLDLPNPRGFLEEIRQIASL